MNNPPATALCGCEPPHRTAGKLCQSCGLEPYPWESRLCRDRGWMVVLGDEESPA